MDDFLGSIGDIVEVIWLPGLIIIFGYYLYKYNQRKKIEKEKQEKKRAAKQRNKNTITIKETKTTKIHNTTKD